ncbi:MAG: TauD/TfdA family dioxygenase [Pseudomonadales bacterium]
MFGELQSHPAKTNLGMRGDAEIFDIQITVKTRVAYGEGWHTDLSCEPIPPMASALYVTEVPASGGGDALFATMQALGDRQITQLPKQCRLDGYMGQKRALTLVQYQ